MSSAAAAPGKTSGERTYKMQYTLIGFGQDAGFRVFTFEGLGEDRTRTRFTVKADLALIRGYEIRVQELPLLCRGLLERRDLLAANVTEEDRTLIYSEDEMRQHASNCTAAKDEVQRKKSMRRVALNPAPTSPRPPQPW
jgi:hypothetical protein